MLELYFWVDFFSLGVYIYSKEKVPVGEDVKRKVDGETKKLFLWSRFNKFGN